MTVRSLYGFISYFIAEKTKDVTSSDAVTFETEK